MSYFDLVGEDCLEKIVDTSADQLEYSINDAVEKLRKYAETRYEKESKINENTFSMNRLKLAVACRNLKSV